MANTTLTPKPRVLSQDGWMNQQARGDRFMLWVDGVGGYLTCLSDDVRIGQAVAGSHVEVPLLGDLSRHQVTLVRQGEGYLIRPEAPTCVSNDLITEPCVLADGDELQLGASLRMRFRQPHPLSSTARLDFLSHHRSQPSSDGILLMGSSCILGAAQQNHVVCRQWSHDVVLVKQGQTYACHTNQPIDVDGRSCSGRAAITLNSRIQGEDFCLSLERID